MNVSTEQKILEAAETEFLSKGYAGARTTAIAEAAGVTHAMLHYYFRSKEKLFSKVVGEKLSAIANSFAILIDDDKPLADCVRSAVESHFDFICANPLLPRFMVSEVFGSPELLALLKEKISTVAAATISRLQEKIDKELAKPVSAVSVILDIVSLNIFPILAMPMIQNVLQRDCDTILNQRREDNVQTILRKLI